MHVNGQKIPASLERNLENDSWSLDECATIRLESLLTRVERPLPEMYDLDGILSSNRIWKSPDVEFYVGRMSDVYFPGNIDPSLTIIIGIAEPDCPIALDYRITPPRVVYLGGADAETYWFELAPSYDVFMKMIKSIS